MRNMETVGWVRRPCPDCRKPVAVCECAYLAEALDALNAELNDAIRQERAAKRRAKRATTPDNG